MTDPTVSTSLGLPSIDNCRDLGGMVSADGRTVRPHLLIRSANLHDATLEDLDALDARGVTSITDLRSKPERVFKEDRVLDDWALHLLPTFKENRELKLQLRDIVTRPGTFIEDLYPHLILDAAAVACWTAFFRLLVDEPGGHLFHCTQGKDRTGVAAALILAALDVPEDAIRADYLATNRYMEAETPRLFRGIQKISGTKLFADIDEFLVATPLYFQTYLDSTESFGAPKGYLAERCGVTDADFRALKDRYLQEPGQDADDAAPGAREA
ncbi:MAG: tyrosine-protein phosphatase [Bifidobacterium sp.]|nr:tyrosine-protein phosphatase [Bifidobacterium sp.]